MRRKISQLLRAVRAPKFIVAGLVFFWLPIIVFSATSSQNISVVVSSTPTNHCFDGIQNFDETGVDCGGALCASCGSGGGGGSIAPQVTFIGKAAPNSLVLVMSGGVIIATSTSISSGDFYLTTGRLSSGNYRFTIYYIDSAGRHSASEIIDLTLNYGHTTTVNNIILSPTLDADKREVKQGELIAIFGEAPPFSEVTIIFTDPSGRQTTSTVFATAGGTYHLDLDTTGMALGEYSVKVKATIGLFTSRFTPPLTFKIGEKTILKEPLPLCPLKGDLNGDCRVNLVDFSIAAYWYKRPLSANFRFLEITKLNGDGKINLTDFSILAYYWTG